MAHDFCSIMEMWALEHTAKKQFDHLPPTERQRQPLKILQTTDIYFQRKKIQYLFNKYRYFFSSVCDMFVLD